jgi:ubiquinone/menaquinone biosynthesis C-methylase UbiE
MFLLVLLSALLLLFSSSPSIPLLHFFLTSQLRDIRWIHANAETTSLSSNSIDLITACFMFHELPQEPSKTILGEMFRVCATRGTVAITDNDPKSSVIQNLPPAIFTLMKSTEPWSDEYYVFDLETSMREAGFVDVTSVSTDPRHRTVMGRKPAII